MVWMLAWSDFVGFSLPSFAYMGISFGKAGTEGVSLMTAFWGGKWCHIYLGYLGTEHELRKFAKCLGAITVLPNEQPSSFFCRCMPATRDADGFLSTCNGGSETFPLGRIMSPSARFRPHFDACPSRRRASTVTLSTRGSSWATKARASSKSSPTTGGGRLRGQREETGCLAFEAVLGSKTQHFLSEHGVWEIMSWDCCSEPKRGFSC